MAEARSEDRLSPQTSPRPHATTVTSPEPMNLEEPYRVVSIERRTATIRELWLRPRAAALTYLPGQYVLLEDRLRAVPQRSYSIANAPRDDGLISLLVTRVPHGQTSTWVHERVQVGDEVGISGPYGTFLDEPGAMAPCLFLAAGSGLAPMRSLVEAALGSGLRRSLTLIFSARTAADVIDGERFAGLRASHPQFRFIHTLTRAAGAPSPRGRIPALLPTVCDDLAAHDVFIAGAGGFVLACAAAAEARGARRGRVHTEAFFSEFGAPLARTDAGGLSERGHGR